MSDAGAAGRVPPAARGGDEAALRPAGAVAIQRGEA